MIISGKVKSKNGVGEYGAKIYVSDSQYVITPKKIGTTSDVDGNFTLDISEKDGSYITAKSISGQRTLTPIIEGVNDYVLDLSLSKVTTIPEVTVKAKKSVQKSEPLKTATKKTSTFDVVMFGVAGLGALLLVIGGIYLLSKKNK